MKETQAQILKHHGGDGEFARKMVTQSYARRHDEDFWQFWNDSMAPAIAEGDSLLDLGAGVGQFVNDLAQRYPNNKVVGIDAADYMLAAQEVLPENGRLIKDDLNAPEANILAGSVAAVMANMLVHELPQPITMFKAVYQWMKPGARFCIIDLVRQPLEAYLEHKYPDGAVFEKAIERAEIESVFEHFLEHNRYHADDILYMLQGVGFKVLENTPQRGGRFVRIVVEKPC
ncbi:MAG: class I SAM-dependent methyltransferase [Gammaproteobacteria bacterium]|nr:class I SAM-dependent methyltransferase [Gammaproteobacteria bacterium]